MLNIFLISIIFLNILVGIALGYFILAHTSKGEQWIKFLGFISGWMCIVISFALFFVTIFSIPEDDIKGLKIEKDKIENEDVLEKKI